MGASLNGANLRNIAFLLFMAQAYAEPIKLYPTNPHYYLFNGRPTILNPQLSLTPISLPEGIVMSANYAKKFKITLEEGETVFIVALKPRQAYEIEVDDEEMRELVSDPGGILSLQLPVKVPIGVRMRERSRPPAQSPR